MQCPYCGNAESKVVDSRSHEGGKAIRRRRECLSCKSRFTTFERVDQAPLMIQKRGGDVEPFDHNKLLRSLLTCTAKRNVDLETLEQLVRSIEVTLQEQYRGRSIPSKVLGDMVLERMKDVDIVAYVRFASVYKDFKDLGEFTQELERLSKKS